jgi:hypothetical protein
MTLGTSFDIQSLRQGLPLTGEYFQEPTSQNGLQANGSTTTNSFHPRPELIVNNGIRTSTTNNPAIQTRNTAPMDADLPFTPAPTQNGLNMGLDEGTVRCALPFTSVQSFSQWLPVFPTGSRS